MTALHRKLVRDLWRQRGQAVTIALVVACGVASFVALYSTYRSLEWGRDTYYERSRFADVFVHLKRAPSTLATRIEALPGVAVADEREVETVMLPMEDLPEPAVGRIIAVPDRGTRLNDVYLRKGRMVEPGRTDEAVVLESFAQAHGLEPGSTMPAVLNGVRRTLRVVGVALSSEYVFAVADYDPMPDPARFAVLWMDAGQVGPAFQMDGAFNDVCARLEPGASERGALDALDAVVDPYGGMGAYGRDRQVSNRFLHGELQQLGRFATVVGAIFLAVAAFLLNVVTMRLVHLQRAQIATLKAIGYRARDVTRHYLAFATVIVLAGAVLGVGLGALLGRGMMGLYEPYFHYPSFGYRLDARVVAVAVIVTVAAGVAATLGALARAARFPPAEAMRPEAPPSYRPSLVERIGLGRLFEPAGRMVLRELGRRPFRTWLSAFGIALGMGVLIGTRFAYDAMDAIIDLQFETAQRDDLTVSFLHPVPARAEADVAHLPGVLATEPNRVVPVRLRAGPRWREVVLTGEPDDARLRRVFEWPLRRVPNAERGIVLTKKLAEILGVEPGSLVTVEALEGDRRKRDVVVAGVANELFGLSAHMSLPALRTLLDEQDAVSSVAVLVDSRAAADVSRRLKDMPLVASVTRRGAVIERFQRQTAETMNVTTVILVSFAATIALGIVYNNARIALSTRERDLASLRVLGFTRREISSILLGELAAYVLLALPLGLVLGTWLAGLVTASADPESYRMPAVVSERTYAFAVAVTVAAAVMSALLVRRKLDRLDLVAVLKTRE